MTGADDFLAAGGGEPNVVAGRYRLPDPATGEVRTWTRASNVGAVLADRFALERWARRRLLRGLGDRPDLLRLLAATLEYDDAKLDEVAEAALHAAGVTEAANLGTVAHEVHARVDAGAEVPEGEEAHAAGYREALARHGLTALLREFRVINTPLGAAGRADVLLREADGTLVIGDEKSTGHLHLAAPEFAPQLAVYATADWVELSGDGNGWSRMGPVRTDYAIVLHVDRNTGAVTPYRADLFLGAYGANLSEQVRGYRRMGRDILQPYVRPGGQPSAGSLEPPATTGRHLQAVPDRTEEASAEAANAFGGVGNEGDGSPGVALLSAAELGRLTKAQVQEYARKTDPEGVGRDLAHQKGKLIEALEAAGKTSRNVSKANDPAAISGPVGGQDHTDPRDPGFYPHVLERVRRAATVADLAGVHAFVVRVGGDQAWTDQVAEAARARANEIDAANPNHAALSRVLACRTQADVAALWSELTVGGSRPEGWPEEVNLAALERVRQIELAAPPAPANPFGPTGPAATGNGGSGA